MLKRVDTMYRKTYLEVDCKKLENNIKNIREVYNDYKYYFGVVKGNAYSHGIEIIKYLIKGGINYLAVSSLEEALEIRELDKRIPVLVMEPILYEGVEVASKNNITITVDDVDYFKKLVDDKIKIKFHLKVDSGMNRFGVKSREDAKYIYENASGDVFLEGIFTHLSSGAGEVYNKQIETFKSITSDIDLSKIPIVHADRSLTLETHEKLEFANGVRLGIVMYGFKKQKCVPSKKRQIVNMLRGRKSTFVPSKLDLSMTTSLYTNVIEVKKVNKGEVVGYAGMSREDVEKVAILPIGFADFAYINPGLEVFINNKRYKVLVVNMDVCMVAIDDDVRLGDRVEIFGDNISIRETSTRVGVNAYKILLSVTDRVPRVYKKESEEYEIKYRRVS